MRTYECFYLSKLIRRCCSAKSKESSITAPPELKLNVFTAVELTAFLGGIAIIFSLVNLLFILPFMQIDEFIYGLTFADESITLKKAILQLAIFSISISMAISYLYGKVFSLPSTKLRSLIDKNRKTTIIIASISLLPWAIAIVGSFFAWEMSNYIILGYLAVGCLAWVVFSECTMLARSLLFFIFFMIFSWIYVAAKELKNIDPDVSIIVTLNDSSTINALRCTISKEGFAVIKDENNAQFILQTSFIKKIEQNKKSSKVAGVEDSSRSQGQGEGDKKKLKEQ